MYYLKKKQYRKMKYKTKNKNKVNRISIYQINKHITHTSQSRRYYKYIEHNKIYKQINMDM